MLDVPPLLIRGRGCPVTGTSPTATIILNNACVTISSANPIARYAGKGFLHLLAIIPVLKSNTTYRNATKAAPKIPNSSITMA